MTPFIFKTTPYAKQLEALTLSADRTAWALHMEQGTGKTKVAIDTAAHQYRRNKIMGLLVVAPNGVHTGWVLEQIPVHMPDDIPVIAERWNRNRPKKVEVLFKGGLELRVLAMNYEALATKKGFEVALRFVKAYSTMMVCDESHRIKNLKAKATKACHALAPHVKLRRTMTGTPATESPIDLYSQFFFLDPNILGFRSFQTFKSHFAYIEPPTSPLVMGIMRKLTIKYGKEKAERMNPQIISVDREGLPRYRNLDVLARLTATHSYRCLRSECADMPGKVYERRYCELNPVQRGLYQSLKDNLLAEINGGIITTPLAITKFMRMQQVIGGFLPDEEGTIMALGDDNPKLDALMGIAEDFEGKLIIWARFTAELELIARSLEAEYGPGSVARYWGDISADDRQENKRRFIEDPRCRFWVGNPRAGGTGVDGLQRAAHVVVYFSNEYSLTTRLQSEDRADRIGQESQVIIIDIEAEETLDQKVIAALRAKKNVADLITGDTIKDWI